MLNPDVDESCGKLMPSHPLSGLTWLRVGGPAEWMFMPANVIGLSEFLEKLPSSVPVFPMGAGSNLIVRDGGIKGVVIRPGRGFNHIRVEGAMVTAGAAAPVSHVARRAAAAGVDLGFLRTIPGVAGGAVRMNAGCYGEYVADVLVSAKAVARNGEIAVFNRDGFNFGYRQTDIPDDWVVVEATFEGRTGEPGDIEEKMRLQIEKRDRSQPVGKLVAGSVFRNPSGGSSTGRVDDIHDLKAWKLIDRSGMRGVSLGGARISPMHANFLENDGNATAADLESLGEEVRKKVLQKTGIMLEWEIMRVGETTSSAI